MSCSRAAARGWRKPHGRCDCGPTRRRRGRRLADNPSFLPWRSTLALALAAVEPVQARSLADDELECARWFAQPRGIGVALRVCGLLEGGDDGIALLAEATEWLRRSPARLELARALYDLGAAQRRAGKRSAAREPLREALELAQQCGADLLGGARTRGARRDGRSSAA